MAIGISSSFNGPEWRLEGEYSRGKAEGQEVMQTRILNLIEELDEEIHDNFGQSGRETAYLIFQAICKLTK
jgi:hypothetical protein